MLRARAVVDRLRVDFRAVLLDRPRVDLRVDALERLREDDRLEVDFLDADLRLPPLVSPFLARILFTVRAATSSSRPL
jgi:hypothetical protein